MWERKEGVERGSGGRPGGEGGGERGVYLVQVAHHDHVRQVLRVARLELRRLLRVDLVLHLLHLDHQLPPLPRPALALHLAQLPPACLSGDGEWGMGPAPLRQSQGTRAASADRMGVLEYCMVPRRAHTHI